MPWDVGAVHHLVVARVPHEARDGVRARLAASGIETGLHYPIVLSEQPALARWSRPCPNAERGAGQVLSLPMHPLLTSADVDAVCNAVLEAEAGLGVAPWCVHEVASKLTGSQSATRGDTIDEPSPADSARSCARLGARRALHSRVGLRVSRVGRRRWRHGRRGLPAAGRRRCRLLLGVLALAAV